MISRNIRGKKKVEDSRTTIKSLHNKMMESFSLEEKKKKLKLYKLKEKELASIKLEKMNDCENEIARKGILLHDNIRELEESIANHSEEDDLGEYLLNVMGVIRDMALDKEPKAETVLFGNIIKKEGQQSEKIFEQYMNAVHGNTVTSNTTNHYCETCNILMTYDAKRCILSCTQCGMGKAYQDPNTPEWCSHVDTSKQYRYKRLQYFVEHLSRFQAKECRAIPNHVTSKLLTKLKKRRITDPDRVTSVMIKQYLKELELTDYYDNINRILCMLSGNKPLTIPKELEQKLMGMFLQTQEPFERHKHLIKKRHNYLSYQYAISKMLRIIAHQTGDEEILKLEQRFAPLKSRSKQFLQEKVWKKITEDLGWPFFPTI